MILYNNRQTNNQSAALEFVPPLNQTGNYDIGENIAFGPVSWEWIHQSNFFSDVQSGAFRQPNGNTLITDANDGYIFEVTNDGDVLWEYTHPGNNVLLARAQKYGYNYFDNQTLMGDVNEDGVINVLDIILTVNIVLGISEFSDNADINQDGLINVLDIVSLVNIILGTL